MEVDASQFAAVVPVVSRTGRRSTPEVVGTGVITRIFGDGQLLSAAHVLDKLEVNTLFIPGPETFVSLGKTFFCSDTPEGGREKEMMDIGYVRLGTASKLKIHPRVTPLNEEDMATDVSADEGPNIHTFVGFPTGYNAINPIPSTL
jgi:hypothetical protein